MPDKEQIFPSRANAVLMAQKILAAKRGMGLLKRKRDAIDMKLREIRLNMADKEDLVDDAMRTAIFSVTKANLLSTDLKPVMVTNSTVASTFMRKRVQKVVGIVLNSFELEFDERGDFPLAGLSCGGEQVHKVRKYFQQALQHIVDCASLEYTMRMIRYASRLTNMRVNALDCVVIPRLNKTSQYINGELEEFEREDFYRLKRSQAKQLEAKIAFTELIKTKNMTEEELAAYVKRGYDARTPVADVLFDSSAFEDKSESRGREGHLGRTHKRKPQNRDEEALFSVRSVNRDPRSSKASFISLRRSLVNVSEISQNEESGIDIKVDSL